MLNSAEHEICPANKYQIAISFLLNIAEHENFSTNKYDINMEMPTIVGSFRFISRQNFMLSWVEHEKCFITFGPGDATEPVWI